MMIGISNLPATYDGALIASLDTEGNVTAEFALDEQGVMDMLPLSDGTLLVCGCDAALGDDWHYGNIYLRSPEGTWAKKRTLENVIHVWGACMHNGNLYMATGAHVGDNATWEARVYISDDMGDTWQHHYVCYYRIYDVISFNGLLYATAWDWPDYKVYVSADDGATWSIVAGIVPEPRIRMVIWRGLLVGVQAGGAGLWTIDSLGNVLASAWPSNGGVVHQYAMNSLAVADNALYVLATSRIWKLVQIDGEWIYHCNLNENCVSLGYFNEVGLVASTQGAAAKLLRIDL